MNKMNNDTYKWDAELYQKSSFHQFQMGMMALERLNPQDGEMMLEIGSGNAMVSIELAKKIPNGHITAIEISKEMCDQAHENLGKMEISNIEIICKDGLEINFYNEFDAVFSNSAIHWIQNLDQMYELIYNSLKPNGRILIQTGLREMGPIVLIFAQLIRLKTYREYISKLAMPWRFQTLKENNKMLEKCNFRDIVLERFDYTMKFEDKNDAINYWLAAGLVPFLSVIPDDLKEEFIEKFRELYFAKMADTPLEYTMARLFIKAKK